MAARGVDICGITAATTSSAARLIAKQCRGVQAPLSRSQGRSAAKVRGHAEGQESCARGRSFLGPQLRFVLCAKKIEAAIVEQRPNSRSARLKGRKTGRRTSHDFD